jgi:hypothetical protein
LKQNEEIEESTDSNLITIERTDSFDDPPVCDERCDRESVIQITALTERKSFAICEEHAILALASIGGESA